jgi:ribose 5-phosphate isomerase A
MSMSQPAFTQQELKQAAAVYAVDTFIRSGMIIGLGSGSTAELFIQELGRRVEAGTLTGLVTVSTSEKSSDLARSFGMVVKELADVETMDVTVDGADEIETGNFGLTKGRGGALLREKLVATASKLQVIIADESKLVNQLGEKMPIPVEVIPFGWPHTAKRLKELGSEPALRLINGQPYLTDGQNYVLDCRFPPLNDPRGMANAIKGTVGVVEHGLFIDIAGRVVIAGNNGVYELEKTGQSR